MPIFALFLKLSAPLSLLTLTITLISPKAANACCAAPQLNLLQPSDGATEVPRNPRVWIGNGNLQWADPDAIDRSFELVELINESGEPVAATRNIISDNADRQALIISPDQLLEAGASYQLVFN